MIPDYDGRPLAVGARVTGWFHGVRYTGVLRQIDPPYPGCGYRHVTVIRDDDGTEHRTFSDSLVQPGSPLAS